MQMVISYDIEKINTLLEDFYNATDINMSLLKPDFTHVGLRVRRKDNFYCRVVQVTEAGIMGCKCSDQVILEACRDAGVKGIIQYGMGLTLRDGNREYYYAALDRYFPGMKERYIRTYGNAYELPSPHNRELTELFHSFCQQNGIWHDNDQVFYYLSTLEGPESQQMSFF